MTALMAAGSLKHGASKYSRVLKARGLGRCARPKSSFGKSCTPLPFKCQFDPKGLGTCVLRFVPRKLLISLCLCTVILAPCARATVVIAYRGHQYRVADGSSPNSTTLGCEAFSFMPFPTSEGWEMANSDTLQARADVLQVSGAYMWGGHCLMIHDLNNDLVSLATAWPLLETDEREPCDSLSGGKLETRIASGKSVYKLPGNCRRSRQRILLKRRCAPGCFHGPNMTAYTADVDPYCASCASGSFSDWASSVCTTCAAGMFANRIENLQDASGKCGATECRDCEAVPGNYCPPATTSILGSLCPQGFYCSGSNTDKQPCSVGKYSDTSGASVDSTCNLCTAAPGNYCPPASASPTGSSCPAGFFCTGGSTDKQACSVGKYSAAIGASSDATCEDCVSGKYSATTGNEDASACLPCGVGNYSDAGAFTCTPCAAPPGRFCPPESTTTSGITCPLGHFCVGGAADKDPCPKNTYNAATGAQNISACRPCPAGVSTPGSSICQTCPAGTRSVAGADEPCPLCNVGTYSNEGVTFCSLCVAGTYSDAQGLSACKLCAAGMFNTETGMPAHDLQTYSGSLPLRKQRFQARLSFLAK